MTKASERQVRYPSIATMTCDCGATFSRECKLDDLLTVTTAACADGWTMGTFGCRCPGCSKGKR